MEGVPSFQTALCVIRNIVHPDGVYARPLDTIMKRYRLETPWKKTCQVIFSTLTDAGKQVKFSTTTYMSGPKSLDKTPEVNALKLLSLQRVFPEYIPPSFREYHDSKQGNSKTDIIRRSWSLYKRFRPATYLTDKSVPEIFVPPYPEM